VAEPRSDDRLVHHELCFGCGHANLFGLQLEAVRRYDGGVEGRFFVKQDHQGPPGVAHGGVMTAALDEAMALLVFDDHGPAPTVRLEIDLVAPARVGTFVTVRAERVEGRTLRAEALDEDGKPLARAIGVFARGASVTAHRRGP
jgi:acyl-coenzyme A thioesterase PaaI-like protein